MTQILLPGRMGELFQLAQNSVKKAAVDAAALAGGGDPAAGGMPPGGGGGPRPDLSGFYQGLRSFV